MEDGYSRYTYDNFRYDTLKYELSTYIRGIEVLHRLLGEGFWG